jgi:hypothetical protein
MPILTRNGFATRGNVGQRVSARYLRFARAEQIEIWSFDCLLKYPD